MRRPAALTLLALLVLSTLAAAEADTAGPTVRLRTAVHDSATGSLYVRVDATDVDTGGSVIADVRMSVEGRDVAVTALDGAFDEPAESAIHEQEINGPGAIVEVCATAVDAAGNRSEAVCAQVDTFDTTPPAVLDVTVDEVDGERLVVARVEDNQAGVAEASFQLDDGPFRPMTPQDGVFGEKEEIAVAPLPPLPLGEHQICIAAIDAAGNDTVRDGAGRCHVLVVTDDTPPVPAIELSTNATTIDQPIRVTISATDPAGGDISVFLTTDVEWSGYGELMARGSADDGATISSDGWIALHAAGDVEVCAVTLDAVGNRAETCLTVAVDPERRVQGSGTVASLGSGLGLPAPDADVTVDLTVDADGTITGSLSRTEPGYDFFATSFTGIEFLDGTATITGTGVMNGVACGYTVIAVDGDTPRPKQEPRTDEFQLALRDCAFAGVVDGRTSPVLRDGDIVIAG